MSFMPPAFSTHIQRLPMLRRLTMVTSSSEEHSGRAPHLHSELVQSGHRTFTPLESRSRDHILHFHSRMHHRLSSRLYHGIRNILSVNQSLSLARSFTADGCHT
jgi:hypothetical protein